MRELNFFELSNLGPADFLGWWSYANNFVNLNIKNDVSDTPLSCVLNNFTLALKHSNY